MPHETKNNQDAEERAIAEFQARLKVTKTIYRNALLQRFFAFQECLDNTKKRMFYANENGNIELVIDMNHLLKAHQKRFTDWKHHVRFKPQKDNEQ